MTDPIINTNSVDVERTEQQKLNKQIHDDNNKKQAAQADAAKEKARKKVEDNINSGRADMC